MSARPEVREAQRLAFGRVAELYDRFRPPYPERSIDALVQLARLAPGDTVVEVGAGTGKATVKLARRGLCVRALEPSAEMARVLAANCTPWPRVDIEITEFERWEPAAPVQAVVCANAWHWLHPANRWDLAHRALAPGRTLVSLWTLPGWDRCPLRASLSDVYRRLAPGLAPDFPMHPDSVPERLAGDWHADVAACGLFASPGTSELQWSWRYDAISYTLLLRTHQDHILLEHEIRERLLTGVAAAIGAVGGTIDLPLNTRVCWANRPNPNP